MLGAGASDQEALQGQLHLLLGEAGSVCGTFAHSSICPRSSIQWSLPESPLILALCCALWLWRYRESPAFRELTVMSVTELRDEGCGSC